jgi:homoserine dehydrogenase
MTRVRIGLLGCGNVGGGVVALLDAERERIRRRHGLELEVVRILVRDPRRDRAVDVDRRLLTTSAIEVLDAGCDVIIEAIGGVHTSGSLVRGAIARGSDVVTANKALLAECGRELFATAARAGVSIGYEASVGGAVPIITALRKGLAGDTVESLSGVLNGTSNYVLTHMHEGVPFEEGVREAQELGFAEADPLLDVSGEDAAQKLRILAALVFDEPIRRTSVTGIENVSAYDLTFAKSRGCVIRQIATAQRVPGGIELTVAPREIDERAQLARVQGEENGVLVHARASGEIFLSGRGAGSLPTAAAVLSDVIEIAAVRATRQTPVYAEAG